MTTIRPHQEVRLAVVMYGGVSLAIYINGVAQEIFQLSLATATNEAGADTGDGKVPLVADADLTGAAATYRLLARLRSLPEARLQELERQESQRGPGGDPQQRLEVLAGSLPEQIAVKFTVDTLSGTSAGGINAVYLGKALACNADPGPLKDLWIDEADILKLINDRHGRKPEETASPPKSLLNGNRMYVKLLDALDKVGRTGDTTKPSGHVSELDVTLTTTDVYGVPVLLQLSEGFTTERRLKDAFSFRYRNYGAVSNDFETRNDPLMAFAARCTSAFPFAFEPAQMTAVGAIGARMPKGAVRDALANREAWAGAMVLAPSRRAAGESAAATQARAFADGGYLDNKPFSYAVDTMVGRLTECPVERKLVYIEPSPEVVADFERPPPNAVENVFLALSLARYETIREDLERVLARNRLVERTRRLLAYVDDDLAPTFKAGSPTETVEFIKGGLSHFLKTFGASYGGYHRLKVGALTDQLAGWAATAAEFDPTSDADQAVRVLVAAWRGEHFSIEPSGSQEDETSLLFKFDLEYRIRRLRFVLGRLADLQRGVFNNESARLAELLVKLGTPTADVAWPQDTAAVSAALARLRSQLHGALVHLLRARRMLNDRGDANPLRAVFVRPEYAPLLRALMKDLISAPTYAEREARARAALATPAVGGMVREVVAAVEAFVKTARENARAQTLAAFAVDDIAAVTDAAGAWSVALKKLCRRFYDFYHQYDFLSFPLTYSTDVGGELATVDVVRISPADAQTLVKPTEGRRKLAGTDLMNFSAFFQDNWRRNDLLWGRLDGAERLITALLPQDKPTLRALLVRDAQQRILAEHYAHLQPDRLAQALIERVGGGADVNAALADPQELRDALSAALAERGRSPRIWEYFASDQGYRVDLAKKPQIWAESMSRGSRVTGRVLETISDEAKLGPGATAARWLTRAATGAWGLVILATPDSVWNLLARHWFSLLVLLSVLLIGLGLLLTNPAVQTFGLGLLCATLAGAVAWWAASDILAGRVKAKTVLLFVVVLLAVYGGIQLFLLVRSFLLAGAG
ncbi:MAG TPA: patatin-like protein [Burkholderiaceae bacterium]|nr:patatin-like protein [Burkholderiaceae bacterium]